MSNDYTPPRCNVGPTDDESPEPASDEAIAKIRSAILADLERKVIAAAVERRRAEVEMFPLQQTPSLPLVQGSGRLLMAFTAEQRAVDDLIAARRP